MFFEVLRSCHSPQTCLELESFNNRFSVMNQRNVDFLQWVKKSRGSKAYATK